MGMVEDRSVAVARGVDGRPVHVRLVGFRTCDVAELDHLVEDIFLPAMRVVRIEGWVEVGWLLRNAGEQRCLGQVQLRRRLVEVGLCGRLDAVRTVAVKDLVEVHGEDIVLRELAFERNRR
jgi:hypothetical protein